MLYPDTVWKLQVVDCAVALRQTKSPKLEVKFEDVFITAANHW